MFLACLPGIRCNLRSLNPLSLVYGRSLPPARWCNSALLRLSSQGCEAASLLLGLPERLVSTQPPSAQRDLPHILSTPFSTGKTAPPPPFRPVSPSSRPPAHSASAVSSTGLETLPASAGAPFTEPPRAGRARNQTHLAGRRAFREARHLASGSARNLYHLLSSPQRHILSTLWHHLSLHKHPRLTPVSVSALLSAPQEV